MLKWLSVLGLLTALSAVGSGCAPYHMGCHGVRAGVMCDPTYCTDGCGTMPTARYQGACGCGECDPCDPCSPCYYGEYSPFGPLAAVFRIFRPITWMGPACGEQYWGDYMSYPPDCCDPCDCHGNYTGMHVNDCPRRGDCQACGTCMETACASGCTDCGCESGCVDGGSCTSCSGHLGVRAPGVPVRQQIAYRAQRVPTQQQVAYRVQRAPARQQTAHRVLGVQQTAYRVQGTPSPQKAVYRTHPVVTR